MPFNNNNKIQLRNSAGIQTFPIDTKSSSHRTVLVKDRGAIQVSSETCFSFLFLDRPLDSK